MAGQNPWEQSPDEGYWRALLGDTSAKPSADGAPAPDPLATGISTPETGWALAEKSYTQGDTLELRVVSHNRGGLLVDLGGLHGFVPASQLAAFPRNISEDARTQELARYVNTMLRLKVIEFERARNRLILSERIVNPPVSRMEQLLAAIQPQQTRPGIVRNVTHFGAFIDLGGVEGLIHVSELAWEYVKHPRDLLTPGQQVQVYVVEVNREQKRVACSLKRLTPNPWTDLAAHLRPGDWVNGVVTSVVPFGAFVRIANGVEGLVHSSELAEGHFLHPRDVVQEGQAVRARVLEIDSAQRRVKLSLREQNNAGARGKAGADLMPPPPDAGYWKSLAESGM
ncbi:MAG: S1 RNA-binding domain-containing protein [Chloroflexi bacterium]|nr:S1 RNA-binding domain-containing protein [Chloroflexota bacterium]